MTLQFFGAVPVDRIPAAGDVLAAVMPRGREATLALGGLGTLPPRGISRVVYARLTSPADSVERLIDDARTASVRQGCDIDSWPPLPHVTVARRRAGVQRGRRALAPSARRSQPRLLGAALTPWDAPLVVRLSTVSLYLSHLRPSRAEYEQLATRRLQVAP